MRQPARGSFHPTVYETTSPKTTSRNHSCKRYLAIWHRVAYSLGTWWPWESSRYVGCRAYEECARRG